MGFAIDVQARSRKGKGLFRKAPDPKEVGERLGRLARRMLKDGVARAGAKQDRYIVELKLHPAAAVVTLAVQQLPTLEWITPPVAREGPVYGGRRAGTVRGPAGELLELVQV